MKFESNDLMNTRAVFIRVPSAVSRYSMRAPAAGYSVSYAKPINFQEVNIITIITKFS